MSEDIINPGHMAKTLRLMETEIRNVDCVLQILDARIPLSSLNPEIERITSGKPHLYIMNKADLADPDITAQWLAYFKSAGAGCLPMNSKQSGKAGAVKGPIEKELSALMERRRKKGMIGARIRVMVVGIPNVGKSTFINSFAGAARAKAANKPGVTRGKQWITVDDYDLMDMPGVLWKKFDSLETASLLQHLGHCNDHIVRARTDLIGAEVQSLFAHIGQTVHSLCLNGRSCLTGSCGAGGAAAGGERHGHACSHDTGHQLLFLHSVFLLDFDPCVGVLR